MEPARKYPEVPRSTKEHEATRTAVAQALTEKTLTARRLDALERAVKSMAEVIQVLVTTDAEARLGRLEETVSRLRAYEVL